jgi:nitrogen fixation-related uncharacterized protein
MTALSSLITVVVLYEFMEVVLMSFLWNMRTGQREAELAEFQKPTAVNL